MHISQVSIENYKSLRSVVIPLSKLTCVVGHNNAGKSTLLQSLKIALAGGKLKPDEFYDPCLAVKIGVTLSGVTDDHLAAVTNLDHRKQIARGLCGSSLKLVRCFTPDMQSKLRWISPSPKEERFTNAGIEALVKGRRAGAEFCRELQEKHPELSGRVSSKTTLSEARDLIQSLAAALPPEDLIEEETEIPTGCEPSIRQLLPTPIYVPAVKDLSDDAKAKESASFGRLLGLLASALGSSLSSAAESFQGLNRQLNRVPALDGGEMLDERLAAVRLTELTIQRHMQDQFPSATVQLEIPPPDLKTIISNACVNIDDGVSGGLDSKGDGMKRSVMFAILRSIADLKGRPEFSAQAHSASAGNILLFEEPELYLHPNLQRVLFDSLSVISDYDQVVTTTHSPLFFEPGSASTFVKMEKVDSEVHMKPFGVAFPISLNGIDDTSLLQMVSFDLSCLAFFSKTVVLVEGDTDHILFPVMARRLNPSWCTTRGNISLHKVHGKGNIKKYKTLLGRFKVRVVVLADLDCLSDGFASLLVSDECRAMKDRLMSKINDHLLEELRAGVFGDDSEELRQQIAESCSQAAIFSKSARLKTKTLTGIVRNSVKQGQWDQLVELYCQMLAGTADVDQVKRAGDGFFDKQVAVNRRRVLEGSESDEIEKLKHELLIALRECDVFLLSRGAIEKYIPSSVPDGGGKPSRAHEFCRSIRTREDVLALCDEVPVDGQNTKHNELEWMFKRIFENSESGAATNYTLS